MLTYILSYAGLCLVLCWPMFSLMLAYSYEKLTKLHVHAATLRILS